MGPRTAYGTRSFEEEFDDDAEQASEVRCINVSPFVARLEVATVPGSKPRRIKLAPGEGVYLQRGLTIEFIGAGRQPVRPTIESLSEREAWPGVRDFNKDGKLVFTTNPGPRLPMVVAEDRAKVVKAQWDQAMAQRAAASTAPFKLTLQANDGTEVEVEAQRPAPRRKPAEPETDDEAQDGQLDEPPPDHDEPLPSEVAAAPVPDAEPVELPAAGRVRTTAEARADRARRGALARGQAALAKATNPDGSPIDE